MRGFQSHGDAKEKAADAMKDEDASKTFKEKFGECREIGRECGTTLKGSVKEKKNFELCSSSGSQSRFWSTGVI